MKNLKISIFLLSVFVLSGCRDSLLDTKTFDESPTTELTNISSNIKDQFFKIPDDIRPESKAILLNIQAQDQENQFVTPNWVKQNGIPIWDKIFSPNGDNTDNTLVTRSARTVKDISFIPLKDTLTQEIKSFIAVYKLEGNTYGYRFYNKQALLNFFPPNNDVKTKIIGTLTVFGFFEENINGKKKLKLPAPYNKTIEAVKIKITKANNGFTASQSCSEVCFHWIAEPNIVFREEIIRVCFTMCSYDGPIMNSDPFGGSTSCSFCGGGLGSTSSSSSGGTSSYTALDGAIYNGSLLSDLSAGLDPDVTGFAIKYPDYAHLVLPLRELKQKLGGLDLTDIEMYVRYPTILTQANSFFNKHGVSEKTREFMKAYNDSFKTDEEFKAMVTAAIPTFLWDVAFDISLEVVEKIVKKFVPGAELSEDVINLIRALKGDDWMDILYKAGELAWDTAKTFNPQLKMFDAAKEAHSLYKKLNKIKEPLEEIYNKVDAATFKKIYAAMSKLTNRNIFDKFGIFVYPNGSKHLQFIGSTKDLFNTIRTEFGAGTTNEIPPLTGIYFEIGDITFTWYPVSGTNDKPTIEIKKGVNVIMKIRQP